MFIIISILQGLFLKVVRELLQRQRVAGQPAGSGQEDSAAGHVSQHFSETKLHVSLQRYKHGEEANGGQSLGAREGTYELSISISMGARRNVTLAPTSRPEHDIVFVCFPCFHKEQIPTVPVHPTGLSSHLGFPRPPQASVQHRAVLSQHLPLQTVWGSVPSSPFQTSAWTTFLRPPHFQFRWSCLECCAALLPKGSAEL